VFNTMMTKRKAMTAFLLAVGFSTGPALAQGEPELTVKNFPHLRQQIRPQAGESRWQDLPWQIDLHAARQKAAAEGKPLFIMSGGGATAIGAC
jgi:hypothetical protein